MLVLYPCAPDKSPAFAASECEISVRFATTAAGTDRRGDGRVRLKDCKSAKGKTYNATVLLSCEADGRSKFSLEFEGGC